MKSKEKPKIIADKQNLKERKKKTWERIVAETKTSDKIEKKAFNKKFIYACACVVLIICFTIPTVLFLSKPEKGNDRFCQIDDYYMMPAITTFSQMSMENSNILHLDWEILETANYVDKTTQEISFMSEYYFNEISEVELRLFIVYPNIKIDFIENQKNNMVDSIVLNNISISYVKNINNTLALFYINDYTYYIEFMNLYEDELIFDVITEVIDSKR